MQDGRGKDNLVHPRVVIGIHGLRRHAPLGSVDGLAELAELIIQGELGRSTLVSDRVVPLDDQLRIVPPFVRIADLGSEFGQFFEGPGFGLGGHPVEGLDVDAVGFDQVRHQHLHAFLSFGWEMARDIKLADGLAHRAFDQRHAPLPARLNLRRAHERLAIELEILHHKGFGQQRGALMNHLPREVGFPILEGEKLHRIGQMGHEARLADNHLLDPLTTDPREPGIEIEFGRQGLELGAGELVVSLVGIARANIVPMPFGDVPFDADDLGGRFLRVGDLGQREHFADVSDIGQFNVKVLLLPIVRLVRKAQAALIDVGDVLVGLLGIGSHKDAEQSRRPNPLQSCQLANQPGFVLNSRNRIELSLDR